MAEPNFLGIEDSFAEAEKINDALFSDTNPDELEDVKKKKAADDAKAQADLLAKQAADKKKAEDEAKKKAAGGTKEDIIDDPTKHLFGGVDDADKIDADGNPKPGFKKDAEGKIVEDSDYVAPDDDEENDEGKTQFEVLSKELYNIGVFAPDVDPDTNEEITHVAKTPEEFKKLFEYQKQTGVYAMLDNHLSKFGQDRLELFNAIFEKGVEPKDYLPIYNEIESLENLSLDTEANQEKIVREAYKRSGLADDKVENKIKRLKDISELQAEAEDLKTMLVEQDKKALKKQEEDKAAILKNEEAKDAQYKASLVKILNERVAAKEFDGIPVTQVVAQKTYDFLYNKKWQDANGKKFTDFDKFVLELNKPENHALKVKAGLLFQSNLDLTKVQKKAVSSESSELFRELTSKKTKQTGKKAEVAAPWNL